jgi:mannitol/fructose-specific phosphotransferase system IIA component
MTQRLSITVPDDVAAILAREENASAYIAESIQLRHRRESIRQMLADHGISVTDEGVARMRRRVSSLRARRQEELASEAAQKAA